MAAQAKGLGKGLSALMNDGYDAPIVANGDTIIKMPLQQLTAGKYQPRKDFIEDSLQELANSIKVNGILQPLLVREISKDRYEIIAGERRFRAANIAGLKEVPVILHDMKDAQALEVALIENIQRQELNALEEAIAYAQLMGEFQYTQEALAKTLGKSRSHVANMLRLNQLPETVKDYVVQGKLSMGHARALVSAENPEQAAEEVVRRGLNVRQTEALIQQEGGMAKPISKASKPRLQPANNNQATREKDQDILELEHMLSNNLGLNVAINTFNPQSGEVVIRYESLMELDEVLRRLGGSL